MLTTELPNRVQEWNGKLVEIIRIVVTDSRGGRAEQLSEEQWQVLPAAERGDVVYFLKDGDFEEPVDQDTYFALPEDRQGRQVHYRRELPRLAEVEAWGRGDEIGIEMLAGGGTVEQTSTGGAPAAMFDGSYGSANQLSTYLISAPGQNRLTLDIGGTVWLKEIRTISQNPPRGYILRGSNGTKDAQGNLQWAQLSLGRARDQHRQRPFSPHSGCTDTGSPRPLPRYDRLCSPRGQH